MKKVEVSCNIIKDILPLYYDDVCSHDSKKMIEEHLSECSSCKLELESIKGDINISKEDINKNKTDINVIKKMSVSWNRSRLMSFIKGTIIGSLLIFFIILGYFGLFHWNITSVPTELVKITNVSEMSDGKIVYYSEINDGYSLNNLKYDMDKEGNFYITPLRPIIKQEVGEINLFEKGYEWIDIREQELYRGQEIKSIFYGTPKDKILIWKKGMELPKTSKEIENMFSY
ncbi:zf-HC2 domain-containing protein [Metabacillus fastidiosus]|uniref:zf-HC2 domain-containing protein n=1 Tax=Metabacillus fastidiosus TaxID=1458 RepID=UPI003D2D032D